MHTYDHVRECLREEYDILHGLENLFSLHLKACEGCNVCNMYETVIGKQTALTERLKQNYDNTIRGVHEQLED